MLTRIFASGVVVFKPLVLLYLIGCVCCTNRSSTICSLDGSTLCFVGGGLLRLCTSGSLYVPIVALLPDALLKSLYPYRGVFCVVGSGALLGPMWSWISSHFRLAVVVSSWKCSRNGSSAIARGIVMMSCCGGGIVTHHNVRRRYLYPTRMG